MINIRLNHNSINKYIAELQKLQLSFYDNRIIQRFLLHCCAAIRDIANRKLSAIDIGANVKAQIINGWDIQVSGRSAKLVNNYDKATYVEFGTGIEGETHKHPDAIREGYMYNVDSGKKRSDGSWTFRAHKADLDLPMNSVTGGGMSLKDGRYIIFTKGFKGTMFLHNAVMEFMSRRLYEKWWKVTLKEFIR